MKKYQIQKTIHWLLLIFTVLFIISGLGISQYKIVSVLTFGLINKAVAFKLHSSLLIPFLILLLLHIYLAMGWRIKKIRRKK